MAWPRPSKRRTYTALVETHLDALHRTAARLTRNAQEAEDVVQETFLRAWRSLDQLREPAGARAWLFCLLRSAYIDNVRKTARRPQLVSLKEEEIAAEPATSLELRDYTERRELEEHFDQEVLRAMDELPEEERLALLFQVFGGLSYQEISEAMECPLGTVMSRLHRAKTALRRRLADYARQRGITPRAAEQDQGYAEA